jgi:hypothetical protein
MKKPLLCAFAAALLLATAAPCLAASPWDGTWKLNEAKSKMTGATQTVTQSGGMYTVHSGAVTFSYACDGKDYPILADRSIACTGGPTTFTEVLKIGGKPYETTKRTLSGDGKTLTEVSTGTHPDGTAFTNTETELRVGPGTGLAGTWKSSKVKDSAPGSITLKVNGDVLHFDDTSFKEVSDAKLDGTPAPITGGLAPPGLMVSNKMQGGGVYSVVTLNGKELSRDMMTLSADGKTLTDVTWVPGKESEKRTYVYDRQ